MTASRAPRMISGWSHSRPCSSGMRSTEKYSGLTKFARTLFLLARGTPENLEGLLPTVGGRRGVRRDPRRHHFRHGLNARQELIEVSGPVLPTDVGVLVHRDADRHDVVRIVSQIGPDQPDKTVDGRSGGGEKQQAQRDLASHQHIVRSLSSRASGRRAASWPA